MADLFLPGDGDDLSFLIGRVPPVRHGQRALGGCVGHARLHRDHGSHRGLVRADSVLRLLRAYSDENALHLGDVRARQRPLFACAHAPLPRPALPRSALRPLHRAGAERSCAHHAHALPLRLRPDQPLRARRLPLHGWRLPVRHCLLPLTLPRAGRARPLRPGPLEPQHLAHDGRGRRLRALRVRDRAVARALHAQRADGIKPHRFLNSEPRTPDARTGQRELDITESKPGIATPSSRNRLLL
mmetsp:Transcript_25975/g.64136  ORF Transcript_25975/g.64136 Transcript_25975/m.64136 type:complete len:243 (-) Transcript_25975:57-785(-)